MSQIYIYLIWALIFSLLSISSYSKKREVIRFSNILSCGKKYQKLCLVGQEKKGLKVFLLGRQYRKTCKSITGDAFQYKDEILSMNATSLVPDKNCNNITKYDLAFMGGNVKKYERLILIPVKDELLIGKLKRQINESGILKKVIENAKYKPDRENVIIKDSSVDVFQVSNLKKTTYLLVYKMSQGPQGPIIYLQGKSIKALAGPCTYPLKGFQLNGRKYLNTGTVCCNCGRTESLIVELMPDSFKIVHRDDSMSM